MSCPDSPGLIVGRSGITINLNGFAITGPGTSAVNDTDYGIDNTNGYNHVTVENGTVKSFYVGVGSYYAKNANINDVTAEDNWYGIDVENSTMGVVTGSGASANLYNGVYFYSNHLVTLSNSNISSNGVDDNTDYYGSGVWDDLSLDTLSGDTMDNNGYYGVYVDQPLTVSSSSGQLYYTIEHSSADNNYSDGFHIAGNSPTTLYQAKVFDNAATFNGTSGSGFGFYAYQKVKGYGNGVRGNASGNCHNVPCHSIP